MFKKYRSIRLPYEKQGYIYFQCRNYSALPPGQRQRIRRTCAAVADRYAGALFAFLTTDRTAVSVGLEHYVSESTLYRLRKAFYEAYAGLEAGMEERMRKNG